MAAPGEYIDAVATETFGPSALATPANAITVGRVLATPLLVVLILHGGSPWPALVVWTVLAATDGADGFVARRHGTTRSGAFLDPLADKLLVLGAMGALVAKGRIWSVPVAVIAARELVLSVYRSYMGHRGVSVPARPSAKLKTLVQDLAVGLALLPFSGVSHRWIAVGVLWAAVVLTVVTGAQYLLEGKKLLRAL